MPSLSVRNIDEAVYQRLRARAAANGISMEEQARRIIRQAVNAPERLGDLALQFFGPSHGIELELPERQSHEPIDLGQ